MKFSTPIIAALAAAPSLVDGYNFHSPRMFVTRRPGRLSPFSPLLREQQAMMNRAFQQSSPRYDIVDSEDKFELSIDVPGMSINDIDVSLNEDENMLTVAGQRETKNGNSRSMNKFQQSFYLDEAAKVSELTAKLENGVLIVTAPKDMSLLEDRIRKIPILSSSTVEEDEEKIGAKNVDIKKEQEEAIAEVADPSSEKKDVSHNESAKNDGEKKEEDDEVIVL